MLEQWIVWWLTFLNCCYVKSTCVYSSAISFLYSWVIIRPIMNILHKKLTCLSNVTLFLASRTLRLSQFLCLGFSVMLVACSLVKNNVFSLSLVIMLPWGFPKTEVPIMEPSGINEVWHRVSEIPELDVESPFLHYSLIKHTQRCGFCMLCWNSHLNILIGPFIGLCYKKNMGGFSACESICQDVYISTNIMLLLQLTTYGEILVYPDILHNSHASLSWGKRTVQCDVVYHYAKLILNNPSEFNLDISEMQLGYEKCREVIKCVTHICYIFNKPWTEKICLNFLFYSVRILAQAHTGLLWKATYQLLVPISCDGEAGRVDQS